MSKDNTWSEALDGCAEIDTCQKVMIDAFQALELTPVESVKASLLAGSITQLCSAVSGTSLRVIGAAVAMAYGKLRADHPELLPLIDRLAPAAEHSVAIHNSATTAQTADA